MSKTLKAVQRRCIKQIANVYEDVSVISDRTNGVVRLAERRMAHHRPRLAIEAGAKMYAEDLCSRSTAVRATRVVKVDGPANCRWVGIGQVNWLESKQ